jgi:hypothetical protein
MTEKKTEDMIHEALEGGGGITQAKEHDQKLIVALMSLKGRLRNVCLLHTYLVIARVKIKFSKELGTTQFIQEVINDRNGKFVFNGQFVEGMEVRTHSPRSFFLHDHDYRRRVRACTRENNACSKEFLDHFLNFIFFLKMGGNTGGYWEEGFRVQGEWNDHEHRGKEGVLGEWKIPFGV